MSTTSPLIVTLQLDPHSFAALDALRAAHFPPARNFLPAHLTLFHALPGAHEAAIAAELAALAAVTPPPALTFPGVRFMGRGVMAQVASPALVDLRAELASRWREWLTPQDRQPFRPHVTLQNKAPADEARRLHAELAAAWHMPDGHGAGLLLWRYLGGPWERAGAFPFSA